jgi:GNAT superfamily N-acetyltransferase
MRAADPVTSVRGRGRIPDVSGYRIRDAGPSDSLALTDALIEAANWNSERQIPRVAVLSDPVRRRYIASWPRPGDAGVLAVDNEDAPVGACWYRLFTADRPGLAGVPGIPEIILGVRPVWRAQGVGRAMLRAALAKAATAGHTRVALSVERGNYAQRLYVSEGFTVVSSTDTADIMVRVAR